jgi:hypothetical protein
LPALPQEKILRATASGGAVTLTDVVDFGGLMGRNLIRIGMAKNNINYLTKDLKMSNLRVTREQVEAAVLGLDICCDDINLAALVQLIGIDNTLTLASKYYHSLKIPARFALACARRVQNEETKKVLDDLENFLISQSVTSEDLVKEAEDLSRENELEYNAIYHALYSAISYTSDAIHAYHAQGFCAALVSEEKTWAEIGRQEFILIQIIESAGN